MKKKYFVVAGEVISRTDGQRHYVGPHELMDLYGVDPKECVIALTYPFHRPRGLEHLRTLKPRFDGRYRL